MNKKIKRSYIREILDATNEKTISFAGGLPSKDLLPLDEMKSASMKVFENSDSLQYSKSMGLDSLREKIAQIYCDKLNFETTKDQILITSGSQQALDIVMKSINKKNILVESPSYIGAISSFNVLSKSLDAFKSFEEFEKKIKNSDAVYLISDFQNPSTNSYDEKQREDIARIINKNEKILIEDGAYNFLDFQNDFKTPISKYCNNSFHLGSFSKIVAPGLRVGWIRADKKLIEKLLFIKESLDLHTATLNQMILDEYLKSNDIFNHIKKINSIYENKMNFMANSLEKNIPSFSFERPKGGMFIYGSLLCDSMEVAKKALEKNLAIVPAEVFYLNKKSNEIRLNFTNSTNEEIEKGIKILAKIVNKFKMEIKLK